MTAAAGASAMNLWIEEPDTGVWHLAVERLCRLHYRAACESIVSLELGLIWPHKMGETGPIAEDRCDGCMDLLLCNRAVGDFLDGRTRRMS